MSLRAKVTGVTVAVLAIGLVAAGIGTMVFLRNVQLAERDQTLSRTVTTDIASSVLRVEVVDGVARFSERDTPSLSPFLVAVYSAEGALLATSGPADTTWPELPAMTLQDAVLRGTTPFDLMAEDGSVFRASIDSLPIADARELNVQLLALPVAPVNRTVTNYISIYTVFALLTTILGALLTRLVVTLTFRSLGQVEQTAMSIAAGDLGQRMTDIAPGTEVGKLKIAINAMLDRVDRAIAQRDASVQQMRRFIGDASHELRTPLVTVRGYAELYRMGAITDPEQTAQSMERIEKEAIRMGMLVEDLLALARLDERRDVVFTPVDLRLVAQDAVLDTRATAPSRVVTYVDTTDSRPATTAPVPAVDASASEAAVRRRAGGALAGATKLLRRRPRPLAGAAAPATGGAIEPATAEADAVVVPAAPARSGPQPVVLGDENRIRQVVTNLLANARRYTADDSPLELEVGVDARGGMGWIAVVDHGEGIPEQIRDKIFQRFWRADTSRARETGGSGLGLSIVAAVVDALHGAVDVEETPGGGATFRASFPLAQARDAAEHLLIETQPIPRLRDTAS